MFFRMLRLDEAVRERWDLSSHRAAVHGAAPCPIPVKEQMLDWWGPILHEYYAGTEGVGTCIIGPEEWLAHKGSVGRPVNCRVHIRDDDGHPLPSGEVGQIWFDNCRQFEYHADPEKTAEARTADGHGTFGDVGYLDDEGYLYLTDRKSFTIVSGGVNIYPQEAEDVLVTHPLVADAAVFGIPNPEWGEEVKAAVELIDGAEPSASLARELTEYCRARLSHMKCPRSVDFEPSLPRQPNGKLYKRVLQDRYRSAGPGEA
jgi:acyl-CoA synthetase (AMP-forming)/AMP-acid ligase II